MSAASIRTREVEDYLCQQIACGRSLRKTLTDVKGEKFPGAPDHMPGMTTVMEWLLNDSDEPGSFRSRYARAREQQAETKVDEMDDIADDGSNDWMERHNGEGEAVGWQLNGEHVQRSKLRLEQRRWYAEKLLPKKYGVRQAIDHTFDAGAAERLKDARDRLAGKET